MNEAIIENGQVVNVIVGHVDGSLPIFDSPPSYNAETHTCKASGYTVTETEATVNYVVEAIDSGVLAEIQSRRSKLAGIEILGVMCSATKADQMGLTAVGLDYSMTTAGGGTFGSTKFEFANGNTLVITADNFATIYNLWVPFRRSFFAP